MKKTPLLSLLAIWAVLLASCGKKDVTPASTHTSPGGSGTLSTQAVVGYWYGTFANGAYHQGFNFHNDGTVTAYDFYYIPTSTDTSQAYIGTGTYSISGDSVNYKTHFDNGQSFDKTGWVDTSVSPAKMIFGDQEEVYTKQ